MNNFFVRALVIKISEAAGEPHYTTKHMTGQSVELAFVDQGYTGDVPAQEARQHDIQLEVIKLPQAKRGFVLLPRSFVVERSFAWTARGSRGWGAMMSGFPLHLLVFI